MPLDLVVGSFVHASAFVEARSGFAHLHPRLEPGQPTAPVDGSAPPPPPRDPARSSFAFDVMIPRAGRYLVWTQFKLAGEERFEPFALDVVE